MKSLHRPFAVFCALAVLLVAGCDRAETTPNGSRLELPTGVQRVEFATGTVQIDSGSAVHTLQVEIAETGPQRERGLMYRTYMPEDAGMLFISETEQEGAFWMFNTRIPLSIAYANEAGQIVRILDMEPCESNYASLCPLYPAGAAFRYALETNRGYFTQRGISVGDRIQLVRD